MDAVPTASERYRALTDRQKTFVTAYLASGNVVESIRKAYRCKSDQTALVMSYQLLQHPRVADCIAELQGKTEREVEARKEQAARAKLLRKVRRSLRHVELGGIAEQRLLAQEERLIFGRGSEDEGSAKPEATSKRVAPQISAVRESVQSSIPIFPPAEPKYRVGTIATDPDDGLPYILLGVSADGSEVVEARLLVKNADGTFFDAVARGTSPTDNRVPLGATPYADKSGVVRAYKTSDGKYVRLADTEAL